MGNSSGKTAPSTVIIPSPLAEEVRYEEEYVRHNRLYYTKIVNAVASMHRVERAKLAERKRRYDDFGLHFDIEHEERVLDEREQDVVQFIMNTCTFYDTKKCQMEAYLETGALERLYNALLLTDIMDEESAKTLSLVICREIYRGAIVTTAPEDAILDGLKFDIMITPTAECLKNWAHEKKLYAIPPPVIGNDRTTSGRECTTEGNTEGTTLQI
jgi:23S rRNA maturation mini-RNase III